ncbi:MAG: hypothetical protein KGI26_07290 [Thaumarchaeota archaeon]|nr:hypothetical protein [Nitrososphaerota archaeon]
MLFLLVAFIPLQATAHAQGAPKVDVKSLYTLDRYGYATINETVRITNNGSSAIQAPSLTFGFGDLSSKVVSTKLTPSGFSLGAPASPGGTFTVTSTQPIQAGGNATFVFSALVNGVVSTAKNGTLEVLVLSSPSLNIRVDRLLNVVQMPVSTSFKSPPPGLAPDLVGSNNTYSATSPDAMPQNATTSIRPLAKSAVQDFNPLRVFYAHRTITSAADGTPLVTDEVVFENRGNTPLTSLHLSLLALPTTKVTVVTATATQPVLLNPFAVSLTGGALDLTAFVSGYPTNGVQAGTNFTLTYQYPLGASYYSVSGGQVTTSIPDTPPVKAFVDSYTIDLSLPQGARAVQGTATVLTSATPWQAGRTSLAYGLSAGWFLDSGVPAASIVFVLLLVGLFISRSSAAEIAESEEEEGASTDLASDMIKAFDEKTDLINGIWPEVAAKDPNEVDKAYFDEIRGRLDSFRSRALQRLNEAKQKSTSQKFIEVVNQIQVTEREVDRASKDKLNLYQQYYLRQMRKEVYDRLLPQYTKRLEKALNQLSDELHTVQREAKLV